MELSSQFGGRGGYRSGDQIDRQGPVDQPADALGVEPSDQARRPAMADGSTDAMPETRQAADASEPTIEDGPEVRAPHGPSKLPTGSSCEVCGAEQAVIHINVDGNTLLMESCDGCDVRRWQLAGQRIDLQEALNQVGEHSGRRR